MTGKPATRDGARAIGHGMAEACCAPARPGDTHASSATVETCGDPASAMSNFPAAPSSWAPKMPMPDRRTAKVRCGKWPSTRFRIDAATVTNRRFAEFVNATGYRTEAETFGWSYVFLGLLPKSMQRTFVRRDVKAVPWWIAVDGAFWAKAGGSGFEPERPTPPSGCPRFLERCHRLLPMGRYDDSPPKPNGSTLPAVASRAKRLPWGNELTPGGRHRCNVWQGVVPRHQHAPTTGISAPRPPSRSDPTATVSTTWPATSGNGARTGSARTGILNHSSDNPTRSPE